MLGGRALGRPFSRSHCRQSPSIVFTLIVYANGYGNDVYYPSRPTILWGGLPKKSPKLSPGASDVVCTRRLWARRSGVNYPSKTGGSSVSKTARVALQVSLRRALQVFSRFSNRSSPAPETFFGKPHHADAAPQHPINRTRRSRLEVQ